MPLYEYRCMDCNQVVEVLQKVSDPELERCPHCHGTLERVLSAPAIQFKGSGWYVTDYSKRHSSGSPETEKSSSKGDSAESSGGSPPDTQGKSSGEVGGKGSKE